MSLRTLYLCESLKQRLNPDELGYLQRFIKECKEADLEVIYVNLENDTNIISKMEKNHSSNGLIICGTDNEIHIANDTNVAYVGFDTSTGSQVILGFEEVDIEYIDRVYRRFHHLPWDICETERLLIREATIEDLDALYKVYEDPDVTKYIEPLYEDREKELAFQESYIENMYGLYGFGLWVVILKESGELIGRAGLEIREIDGTIEPEIAYVFAKKHQQKGYAFEAMSAIVKYTWDYTEYDCLNCYTQSENKKSVKLATALGFTNVGEETIFYCGQDTVFQRYVLRRSI